MDWLESHLAPEAVPSPGVDIRLLGPVSLAARGREIAIRSPKQRVILAMLALSPRVSVDAMADALWRDTPPASVGATVHTLVSRLRRTLEDAGGGVTIRSQEAGYVMDVDRSWIDVHRFEADAAAGRRALAGGSPAEAARLLRAALSLWRGPALEDVSDRDFARAAAAHLDEARSRTTEELAEAELACGRPATALEVLEPMTPAQPFRERLRALEMVALYRLGRQAEALAAFQDLRRCLAEELGLEPTPALCGLERQILLQDPALDGLTLPAGVPGTTTAPAMAAPAPPPPYQPAPLTTFIGRTAELAELADLLPQTRLLTITGVAGVGKTRLALELAARCGPSYADGVTVVELASASDTRPIAGVVLAALGLDAGGPSVAAAEERLERALAERHLVLVLDNCEHLVESVSALIHLILLHCPAVTILATSRQLLSVPGETVWVAPGLSLPPEDATEPADLEGSDAAALFVARARLAQPGFGVTPTNVASLTAICRRLDGLALALELAAARVHALGVIQLAEHLDDRFRLLTGGPRSGHPRHHTLAAAMDWSYEALSEPEQRLLRRLAVFPQRFDLAAATAVAGEGSDPLDVLELLARLVDKSLLVPEGATETARYRLLETVREYGTRKLVEAGEEVKTAVLHRQHFVGLIEEWHRRGENFFATEWMLRAAADRENFHSALINAIAASDTDSSSVLVAGLWKQWYLSGSVPPAVADIDPATLGCADPSLLIEALIGYSVVPKMSASALRIQDLDPLFERALAVADEQGGPRDQGWARHWVGYFARSRGDVDTARALMEEALDRFSQGHSPFELAYIHYELGWVDMTEGDVAGARKHFRAGVAFSEAVTGYEISALSLRASLALAEAACGDTEAALARAREAVETARPLPLHGILMMTLVRAAETGAVAGVPARPELAEALRLLGRQGGRQWVAAALTVAALLHEAEDRHGLAARLLGGAVAVAEDLGEDPEPIPVMASLVRAARQRLTNALGDDFADQQTAGRQTPVYGLLQAALSGLDA